MNKLIKRLALISNNDFNKGIDSATNFLQKALNEIQHIDDMDREDEIEFERVHDIFNDLIYLIDELNKLKF